MSILNNAINSIQVGVEDYQSKDVRRHASAIRNISASIVLLYKEKLCRLSPNDDSQLLIMKDIRPTIKEDGSLGFKSFTKSGGKTKTVDVTDIQKLFSSLNVKTNWDKFNKINRLRNDIEHFYSQEDPSAIREIISDSFILIRDFLITELHEDPFKLVGTECWNSLLEISEIFEKELATCKRSKSLVDWPFPTVKRSLKHLRCSECPSELVKVSNRVGNYPDINLICCSCGHEFVFSDAIVQCIHDELFADAYEAMTRGGEYPWEDCDECGLPTFVVEESACMHCCHKIEYEQCLECKKPVSEHGNEKLCDHCAYIQDLRSEN
jgi:hypothetical protein